MKTERERDGDIAGSVQGRESSPCGFFLLYVKYHMRGILLYAAFCAIFEVVFALYHLPVTAVVYPGLLCGALGLAVFWRDSRRLWEKHKRLRRLTASWEEAADMFQLQDSLPETDSVAEADYQEILRFVFREQASRAAQMNQRYHDMMDYYTVWAHQIKTPIASIRLNMQDEDSDFSRLVAEDLQRIEQYAEMVLAFLRLDSTSTDYVFRSCDLDEIIRQTIRKFAGQFIRRGLRLNYEPVSVSVVTDEKWLSFVLGQILSNALKYTRAGGIDIFLKEPVVLCVRDTGIGIAPEDLPRIFEKGYTGYNGRTDHKASGLGLYLCRRVCENLGCSIWAESVPGQGTSVFIDLSRPDFQAE